jgi:Protein of unknown function (DUF3592)
LSDDKHGLLVFLGVATLILCILSVILSLPFFWRQYDVLRSWPETQAQVLGSEVVTQPSSPHEQLYAAKLQVLYTVDDRPVSAELISFQSQNYEQTATQVAQFPVGSRHPIRYDPHQPAQARIGAGWNLRFFAVPLVMLAMGAIFGGIAGVLLIWARSVRSRTMRVGGTDTA